MPAQPAACALSPGRRPALLLAHYSQVRIKAAIKGVKEELRGMEVRIGVVGHSLLQRGLRERQARIKAGMLAVEASTAGAAGLMGRVYRWARGPPARWWGKGDARTAWLGFGRRSKGAMRVS